ncbi:MAG: lamin tail domain-containing protein, partial [Verrucomicrobiales bacterium]
PETVPNWQAALEYIDPVNIADYFLFNIYTSMWDWPHNNWVLSRERSDAGRFRAFVWDAEGGIGQNGVRGVSTNMIDSFILGTVAGSLSERGTEGELRDLWRALVRWEEFRILFADRIHKHLFHGGALDDRDFDNSDLNRLNEQVVDEYDELLSFVYGEQVISTHARNWATDSGGPTRRSYLFGPDRESFRDHALWPAVAPPDFSQHGGQVAPGFSLQITSESGNVHFTTDGSDPRLAGGAANPAATVISGGINDQIEVEAGAGWMFDDTGTDFGTAWREPGFNDVAWAAGPAPLGYGGIRDTVIATTMNTDRNITAYVRKTFDLTDVASVVGATCELHIDGGAVLYLNGMEVVRDGMPAGEIQFSTLSDTDGNEGVFDGFTIPHGLLVEGPNVLAAEVHNRTAGSADMVFDLRLTLRTVNTQPLQINSPTVVRARVLHNGEWSAVTEAIFATSPPASAESVVISEVFYNPVGPLEDAEFIELLNISGETISLSGVRFDAGIHYTFPSTASLLPGERIVLTPADYTGQLANGGENLRLVSSDGGPIREFRYDDDAPWPETADGDGRSLVLANPSSNPDHGLPESWIPSAALGGTPGDSDSVGYQAGNDPITFFLGSDPIAIEVMDGQALLKISRDLTAEGAEFEIETSGDLSNWITGEAVFAGYGSHTGNFATMVWQLPQGSASSYARVRIRIVTP